jgi:hypothetical protein
MVARAARSTTTEWIKSLHGTARHAAPTPGGEFYVGDIYWSCATLGPLRMTAHENLEFADGRFRSGVKARTTSATLFGRHWARRTRRALKRNFAGYVRRKNGSAHKSGYHAPHFGGIMLIQRITTARVDGSIPMDLPAMDRKRTGRDLRL